MKELSETGGNADGAGPGMQPGTGGPNGAAHERQKPLPKELAQAAERARPAGATEPAALRIFEERLCSTPEAVRETLVTLVEVLGNVGLSESDRIRVEVVLAEILNNIVEHAYSGARDGWISLRVELVPEAIDCELLDEGDPMPDMRPPSGKPRDLDVDRSDLPEGGFGWFLIRELTQRLAYAHERGRNRLTFRIATGIAD